jgi:hypothetical protein
MCQLESPATSVAATKERSRSLSLKATRPITVSGPSVILNGLCWFAGIASIVMLMYLTLQIEHAWNRISILNDFEHTVELARETVPLTIRQSPGSGSVRQLIANLRSRLAVVPFHWLGEARDIDTLIGRLTDYETPDKGVLEEYQTRMQTIRKQIDDRKTELMKDAEEILSCGELLPTVGCSRLRWHLSWRCFSQTDGECSSIILI